jgi:ankyrin repeat protein
MSRSGHISPFKHNEQNVVGRHAASHFAAQNGHEEIFKLLLDRGPEVKALIEKDGDTFTFTSCGSEWA